MENQFVRVPKRFNLVQLIERDVYVNIIAIPRILATMATRIPVHATVLVLPIQKVGWALSFCLGVAMVNLVLMVYVLRQQRKAGGVLYVVAGTRLQFFQTVLYGIRFIKGIGGEELMLGRLAFGRLFELVSLQRIYSWMCLHHAYECGVPKWSTSSSPSSAFLSLWDTHATDYDLRDRSFA